MSLYLALLLEHFLCLQVIDRAPPLVVHLALSTRQAELALLGQTDLSDGGDDAGRYQARTTKTHTYPATPPFPPISPPPIFLAPPHPFL